MSYILDALKKMEHEKSRKTCKSGMSSISGELFMGNDSQPRRGGMGKTIALIVATALCAIAATCVILRLIEKRGDTNPHPVSARAPLVAVSPPAAPVPVVQQPAPPRQSFSPAARPPMIPPRLPGAARIAPSAADSPPRNSDGSPEKRRKTRKQPLGPFAPEQRPVVTGAGMSAPTVSSDIAVSGIAWQDDRSDRRAVVNGFLMKEGGVVAGARIVEIRQDRVRFSQSGRDFELLLVATEAPPAVKAVTE